MSAETRRRRKKKALLQTFRKIERREALTKEDEPPPTSFLHRRLFKEFSQNPFSTPFSSLEEKWGKLAEGKEREEKRWEIARRELSAATSAVQRLHPVFIIVFRLSRSFYYSREVVLAPQNFLPPLSLGKNYFP